MVVSWVISGVVGFGLGVLAGAKEGTWIDKAIKTYCYILQSTPTFWVGLVLLMVFSVYLGLIFFVSFNISFTWTFSAYRTAIQYSYILAMVI